MTIGIWGNLAFHFELRRNDPIENAGEVTRLYSGRHVSGMFL